MRRKSSSPLCGLGLASVLRAPALCVSSRRAFSLCALLCAWALLAGCAPARSAAPLQAGQNQASQNQTGQAAATKEQSSTAMAAALVQDSARTLAEMRKAIPERALDEALLSARAVIILPGVYQAGFMYSVHAGSGVLVARRADGGWGAPVFMSMGGAGYGPQIGFEKARVVLAVQEEEMLERILSQGFNLDASVKYDVLGVREEHGPGTLTEGRPVIAFYDGVGVMAGVALRGGILTLNRSLTRNYHASETKAEEIMRSTGAPGMETFALWGALGVTPEAPGQSAIIRVERP